MARAEWGAAPPPPQLVGEESYEADVCPGWVVVQPAVVQGSHAFAARRDGALEAYYPDLPNPILEAADVCLQAFNRYEAAQLRDLKERS